jgi:uncharacterized protein (DUF1778 family)
MPAHKKPKGELRSIFLKVRISRDEQRTLESAAKALEVDLSGWVRDLALKAADRALAKAVHEP